ncbi:MAG: magnesium transporter [Chloroflexi bacterium]|nr:MAG: magnesium transporter [Chloroflexota bacterium]
MSADLRQTQTAMSLLLSQLVHSAVVNPAGDRLGRVEDVIVRLADSGYPRVSGFKVRIGGRDLFVPEQLVLRLEPGRVQLQGQTLDLGRFERRPGEVLLREDVLDRRLIHVAAGRLVHANDLVLAESDTGWRLVGVDPSPRGIVQRLLPGQRRDLPPPEAILDWSEIQPFVGHVPSAGLLMPLGPLKRLHPAQIADLVEGASHEQGEEIIEAVEADPELTADVFEELEPEHQVEFLEARTDSEAAELLAHMAPDDAADLLNELDQTRRRPVLELMPVAEGQKLRNLLQHNPSTAGGMMSPDFIAVERGTTLESALERVRSAEDVPSPLLGSVFVTDVGGRLVGTVGIADVVRGDPFQSVEDLPQLVTGGVPLNADLQDVALKMTDFNLVAVGVTDEEDRLIGAISVDDLLESLVPEEWRRRAEASSSD